MGEDLMNIDQYRLSLSKSRERGSEYWSALWEIDQIPGLILLRVADPRLRLHWTIRFLGADGHEHVTPNSPRLQAQFTDSPRWKSTQSLMPQERQEAYLIWTHLNGQNFPTRRDALLAVWAARLSLEAAVEES